MSQPETSPIFPNTSEHFFRKLECDSIIDRAHQTFREKSYLERHKNLYTAANIASFLFQGLSALFAFTFGHSLIAGVMPSFGETFHLIASGLLTAILLIGIEVFKRLCFGSFVVSFIQAGSAQSSLSTSWGVLTVNILLIGVAAYTSSQGAKELTLSQTDRSEQINQRYAFTVDSVAKTFEQKIFAENKALNDFNGTVAWRGKINMAEKNTAFTIGSHNRRLEKLQLEKEQAMAALYDGLQNELSKNTTKTTKDQNSMLWLSLMVEIAGLLCIGFVYFFLSRVYIESSLTNPTSQKDAESQVKTEPIVSDLGVDGSMILNTMTFQTTEFQHHEAAESLDLNVEFDQPMASKSFLTPQLVVKPVSLLGFVISDTEGFLKKHAAVIQCLEDGLSNKQTAKLCKVSQTTVHNVKRCLRNIYRNESKH